jgi:hypothetical protein
MAGKIKKRVKRDSANELVPIRLAFEVELKQDADEECDIWSITMSELIRHALRNFLRQPIEERRNILFPLPSKKR